MTDTSDAAPACQVLELRQYTLRPGQRDVLIDLFEREFVESQEALGMPLFGQFRDLDDPDRFVWLRGFTDMPARALALAAFYDGPVWRAHREAANATMLDSDNVLLLRPARPDAGFQTGPRPTVPQHPKLVVATLCYFAEPIGAEDLAFFDATVVPLLTGSGAQWLATLMTEAATNTFPRLPVREGEHVLACFTAFDSVDAHRQPADAFEPGNGIVRIESLRLMPTARSRALLPRDA